MSQEAPPLLLPPSLKSGPKRPRLSLQTASPQAVSSKAIISLKADIDTTSPTAFNTLSNAYAAAIEQASPKVTSAPSPFNSKARPTSLRLITNASTQVLYPSQRTQTPGPFSITYPDTPTTSYGSSTPITAHPCVQALGAAASTYTPPQSAHPPDESIADTLSPRRNFYESSPRAPRRRATIGSQRKAPYTHPRSLHSILRNSPLPPRSAVSPMSPTRSSQRLAERASKKVGYNVPLTQTITTNKYVKSHIELLAEEVSPYSPVNGECGSLDLAMAYTGDETRDGGQTPGPFEEMRRRMAGLGGESELETPVNKKRKREKRRRWVWTIGVNEEDGEGLDEVEQATPITAVSNEQLGRSTPIAYIPPPRVENSSTGESEETRATQNTKIRERPASAHSI